MSALSTETVSVQVLLPKPTHYLYPQCDLAILPAVFVRAGLIDDIVRGKDDYTIPPSMVKQLKQAGIIDSLTPRMLNWH